MHIVPFAALGNIQLVCPIISSHPLSPAFLPSCFAQVDGIESDAMFILLVEKDAAFMRLAEDRFYNTYPCIIITAKGQPDVATRWVGCLFAAGTGCWGGVATGGCGVQCQAAEHWAHQPGGTLIRRSPSRLSCPPALLPCAPPPASPPRSLFLRKLKQTLRIPVLALVDSDPYGLKILSVYMKGGWVGGWGRLLCCSFTLVCS